VHIRAYTADAAAWWVLGTPNPPGTSERPTLRDQAAAVVSRAELLKGHAALLARANAVSTTTSARTQPPAQSSAAPAPGPAAAARPSPSPHPSPGPNHARTAAPPGDLTPAEIAVLKASSVINGREFLPWQDDDRTERCVQPPWHKHRHTHTHTCIHAYMRTRTRTRTQSICLSLSLSVSRAVCASDETRACPYVWFRFVLPEPFTDPDGPLPLSAKQARSLSGWVRPSAFAPRPVVLASACP
jgi:hypothetical protein